MGIQSSTSADIQPGLSSSNVLCFIAIVAIVSFEQINQLFSHSMRAYTTVLCISASV